MPSTFQPPAWVHYTNIYEVNLRQYTPEGTINAFANHLPRLKEMGVETLWFMPITPIALEKRKGVLGSYYACSDYMAINPEFGKLADFKNLVTKAHEMGFKVIIDWVANHTGWDHVWTKQHPEWYKIEKDGSFKSPSGMEDIIELDFNNTEMRNGMMEAMRFWVNECDIDGFRCDLAFLVELDFWQQARQVLDVSKKLFWLGELDLMVNPEYMQVFDAAYTWTWMHKIEEFYKKNSPLIELLDVLHSYETEAPVNSIPVWFTSNHDENSWNGTEYEKYGDMAMVLAGFSCTWAGIPLIYSGQELPNKKRLKFFDKNEIEWKGKNELHEFYKILLNLRTSHPALRAGDKIASTHILKTDAEDKVLVFLRKNGSREVLVILNFSKGNLQFKIADSKLSSRFRNIFTNEIMDLSINTEFKTCAWEFLVFEK